MAVRAAQDSISLQARIRSHIRALEFSLNTVKSEVRTMSRVKRVRVEAVLKRARGELEKVLT